MATKTPISSIEEYNELFELYTQAKDRIESGLGMGYSGVHYEVEFALNRHGVSSTSRNDTVVQLKKLLDEYERNHLGVETEENRYADMGDQEE